MMPLQDFYSQRWNSLGTPAIHMGSHSIRRRAVQSQIDSRYKSIDLYRDLVQRLRGQWIENKKKLSSLEQRMSGRSPLGQSGLLFRITFLTRDASDTMEEFLPRS
jgi:hypothetical protein